MHPLRGRKQSPEHLEKRLSAIRLAMKRPSVRKKLSVALLGKKLSKAHCKAISNAKKGKPTKHGYFGTKVYHTWQSIKDRCLNKNSRSYKNYGAKGRTICERWLKFENFLSDIGDPPSPRHTIDRINNDGNYEPNNCRWATYKDQANNKTTNRRITANGQTKTVSQWADFLGVKDTFIRGRLHRGWSEQDAVLKKKKINQHG